MWLHYLTDTAVGQDPKGSLELVNRLGLYSTIFTDPTTQGNPVPDTTTWPIAYKCLDQLRSNETPGSIYLSLVRSDDAKYLGWVLVALTPWSQIPLPQPAITGGKLPLPLGTKVAREGIKSENKICNVVTGSFRHYEQITELKEAIRRKYAYTNKRDTVGMMIRRWDAQGGHWRLQALFAILVEALKRNSEGITLSAKFHSRTDTLSDFKALFTEWQDFIDHLEGMDIMDAPAERSIIDGKILSKELGGVKPGVWMRPALDVVMEWQLRNPGVTDYEGAIAEVKQRSQELKIPIS